MSTALAGRFLTAAPPGKPCTCSTLKQHFLKVKYEKRKIKRARKNSVAMATPTAHRPSHLGEFYSQTCGPHAKSPALGFPGGAVVESLPANAGDAGSSPGLGGSHMPRSD